MNTPVSFEIAKLLKERGFDQKLTDIGYNVNGEESFDYSIDRINGVGVASPTIAEVVMWLYEKHKFWTEVTTDINGKFCFPWLEGKYNSPTEAYSAAIEYTLKNLIQ